MHNDGRTYKEIAAECGIKHDHGQTDDRQSPQVRGGSVRRF